MIMRVFFHWVFMPALTAYLAFMAVPFSWWFEPGEVRFENAVAGTSPELSYSRHIHRDVWVNYRVVVREAVPNRVEPGPVVCEGGPSLAFTFVEQSGPVVGKDLEWWLPHDERCHAEHLGPGNYWAETCWTLVNPLGDLLPGRPRHFLGIFAPRKTVCRTSNVFTVYAAYMP